MDWEFPRLFFLTCLNRFRSSTPQSTLNKLADRMTADAVKTQSERKSWLNALLVNESFVGTFFPDASSIMQSTWATAEERVPGNILTIIMMIKGRKMTLINCKNTIETCVANMLRVVGGGVFKEWTCWCNFYLLQTSDDDVARVLPFRSDTTPSLNSTNNVSSNKILFNNRTEIPLHLIISSNLQAGQESRKNPFWTIIVWWCSFSVIVSAHTRQLLYLH